MKRLGPYLIHPIADEFPLLEGEQFSELVEDIRLRGLQQPIVLTHDGQTLVDGRNRYRACLEAKREPAYTHLPTDWSEEALTGYIVSANLRRRQLTPGAAACIGLVIEQHLASEARKRKSLAGQSAAPGRPAKKDVDTTSISFSGLTRTQVARQVGVAEVTFRQVKALAKDAPDLFAAVKGGADVAPAYRQLQQRRKQAPRPESVHATSSTLLLPTHDGQSIPYPQPKGPATFNRTTGPGISWAGWSWNPVTGCLHGCDYCYARELALRESYRAAYPAGFTPLFHPERLSAPGNTPVPPEAGVQPDLGRVFVCSMADLYGSWVPDEWIDQVHAAMLASPRWRYLLLTKFPRRYGRVRLPASAWVGTSVDTQKRVRDAEETFRHIGDVAVKWLSIEPLHEPLHFSDLSGFDWVVIGAQTETRQPEGTVPSFAPPIEWVARLIDQAREAGCRIHCKPNLLGRTDPQSPGMTLPEEDPIERGATT